MTMEGFTQGLVSIVTPSYKAAKLIGDTIQAIQAQTYANWELIIVDDCSPDNTVDVISQYAQQDSRIKLIVQAQNAGPAEARNRGLCEAEGRYIAFCDADDMWVPEKLSIQLAAMSAKRAPLSFTGLRRISEDSSQVGRYIGVPESITYEGLLKNTVIITSSVIVDRAEVGDFRMTKTFYDDFVLWLSLLKPGRRALGVNEDLLRYRVVSTSYSRNKKKSAYWVWRTYRDIEKLNPMHSAWCFLNYAFNGWKKYREF